MHLTSWFSNFCRRLQRAPRGPRPRRQGDAATSVAAEVQALEARELGYSPPTMIEAGGLRQLVIWHAESLNSLNAETGKLYWSVPLVPEYGMAIMAPRQRYAQFISINAVRQAQLGCRLRS